jgi:hypothetical protein
MENVKTTLAGEAVASPKNPEGRGPRVLTPDQRRRMGVLADGRRKMLLDCHPWQRDAVIDPAKRISMLVGRGGAKTTTKRVRALIKVLLLLPNQYVGYAATSADQARELNWDPIKRVCEAYGISSNGSNPDVTFLDTKMVMRCHRTGSRLSPARRRGQARRREVPRVPAGGVPGRRVRLVPPELLEYLVDECVGPRLGEALACPPGLLEQLANERRDRGPRVRARTRRRDRPGQRHHRSAPAASSTTSRGRARDKHRPYARRDEPEYADWIGYSSHAWNLKDVVALPDAKREVPGAGRAARGAALEFKRKGWDEDTRRASASTTASWSEDNTTNVFRYRIDVEGKPWNQWDPFGGRPLEGLEGLKLAIAALPKNIGAWHFGSAWTAAARAIRSR